MEDPVSVIIDIDGEEYEIPKRNIQDISLAYACTVHKSQGSEYDYVLISLPKEPINMLQRNLLYTGITRCKSTLILVGQKEAVDIAIDTQDSVYRRTMLGTLINRYCDQLRQSGNSGATKKKPSAQEQEQIALSI